MRIDRWRVVTKKTAAFRNFAKATNEGACMYVYVYIYIHIYIVFYLHMCTDVSFIHMSKL